MLFHICISEICLVWSDIYGYVGSGSEGSSPLAPLGPLVGEAPHIEVLGFHEETSEALFFGAGSTTVGALPAGI